MTRTWPHELNGENDLLYRRPKALAPPGPPHYAVPAHVPANLVPVGDELARLEESARWSSQTQFEAAKAWQRWNFRLGVPASVFGLFSGGAAFLDSFPRWVVGTGALVGAALAGIMTVLAAERRAQRGKTCANTFHDIQDDARRLLLIDLATLTPDEARTQLTSLTDRYSETRHAADAPNRRAYNRASKNIREGGQQFAVDTTNHNRQARPTKPGHPDTDSPKDA